MASAIAMFHTTSLLLVLCATSQIVVNDEHSPTALQRVCFDAVVRVSQVSEGTGTGFVIYYQPTKDSRFNCWIATAYHCVDADSDIFIESVDHLVPGRFSERIPAELLAFDELNDVAMLSAVVSNEPGTIALGHLVEQRQQFPAITIGCTGSAYPSIWDDEVLDADSLRIESYWKMSNDSLPGRSGGPLICLDIGNPNYGRVLGVCTRRANGNGFYCSLAALREVARRSGVPVEAMEEPYAFLPFRELLALIVKVLAASAYCSIIRVRVGE